MRKPGLKNKDALLGKKDNIGRNIPRERVHLNAAQLRLLKEIMDFFFLHNPDLENDEDYNEVREKISYYEDKVKKPLMTETADNSLF